MNVGDGKFKLEDRLIRYTGDVIEFTESLNWNFASQHLKRQLIRSSISPVLLFGETQASESDKDYIHKASILVKELKECRANLKILNYLNYGDIQNNEELLAETEQLIAIFSSIIIRKRKRP